MQLPSKPKQMIVGGVATTYAMFNSADKFYIKYKYLQYSITFNYCYWLHRQYKTIKN